jgi:ankyrin repeat protein
MKSNSSLHPKHPLLRLILGIVAIACVVVIYPRLLGNLILSAAEQGEAPQVRLLLRLGADPDSFGWKIPMDQTPLMLAASKGSLPTVQVLLDHGADVNTGVNEWGVTPLMCAVESGNPMVVRLLLAHGARLDSADGSDETSLTLSQTGHHPEIVQMLRRAGEKY